MGKTAIWLLLDSKGFGGIERHVENVSFELRECGIGCEIVFWDRYPYAEWIARLKDMNLAHRMLDGTLAALVRTLRLERPALLHTHGYKANLMGRAAALISGTPVIASFHAGLREPFPVNLYQRADEITSFLGGRIAVSAPIAYSLPFASDLVENFIPERPAPGARPLPRAAAFAGRLTYEKGFDLFCEIARKTGPSIEWHVFGDGPLREDFEAAYGAQIRFHGFTSGLEDVWPRVGLLVMPSRAEGLPMAAIEALSHGVPVAASRVGGLPSAIVPGVTGWLFEAEDVGGACEAICAWSSLSAGQQAAMRNACWDHAITNFSARKVLPHLLDVYARQAPAIRDIPR